MTTVILVIDIIKKILQELRNLAQVPYIFYLILLQKNMSKKEIMVLMDLENKINARNSVYLAKLDLQV